MADVVMDMTSNPLTPDELKREDTDAVVMPDYFARVRSVVCRADGSPRLLIWLLPMLWPVYAVLFLIFMASVTATDVTSVHQRSIPHAVNGLMFTFLMTFPIVFAPQFASAIADETGALAKLGVGSTRVAASKLQPLERWPFVLVPLAGGFGFSFGVSLVMLVTVPVYLFGSEEAMAQVDTISGSLSAYSGEYVTYSKK